MNMKDYFTLEYSPSQKCFHFDTISSMCRINLDILLRGDNPGLGYICLGIFETEKARQAVADKLRSFLNPAKEIE